MADHQDEDVDDDIEEEAEFVSGPGENEHDIKYKDGEENPEEDDEDVEEPDVEEEAEFVSGPGENDHDIKFKDPKDDDKEGDEPEENEEPEEPEEPEDVEEEAEFVSGPGENEHDIKYKDPKDGDGEEPDDDKENADAPKEPEDVEAEAEFVSGPGDKSHDIKYKDPEPQASQWQPKPRPPPEPIDFPPQEKTLCQILKEEKIPPTKRYAKKPCTRKVIIPFVIPWEQTAAKETQIGMGAFGKGRNPFTKVDQGSKELKQGSLHSENTLTLFAKRDHLASRKGDHSFGAHRTQVAVVVDNHHFDTSKLQLSEGIVPKQAGGGMDQVSQSGQTPMGAIRKQVLDVKYRDGMSPNSDPQGNTFLSRQCISNPNNHAGSGVMDRRRNVVSVVEGSGGTVNKHHRLTEGIIPRLFDTQDLEKPSGTGAGYSGLGAFRQVTTKTEGGYGMTYDEEVACKRWVPYQTGATLHSQAHGGGGFGKTRDVVHVNY